MIILFLVFITCCCKLLESLKGGGGTDSLIKSIKSVRSLEDLNGLKYTSTKFTDDRGRQLSSIPIYKIRSYNQEAYQFIIHSIMKESERSTGVEKQKLEDALAIIIDQRPGVPPEGSSESPPKFTFMTWNICWECTNSDRPPYYRWKQECPGNSCESRIINSILHSTERFDIVCLQEVAGPHIRGRRVLEDVFYRSVDNLRGIYDNANQDPPIPLLLTLYNQTRFQKINSSIFDLKRVERDIRVGLLTILQDKATGEDLCIFNLHCGHDGDPRSSDSCFQNRKFLTELHKVIRGGNKNVIVAGDFNEELTSDNFQIGGHNFIINGPRDRHNRITCCKVGNFQTTNRPGDYICLYQNSNLQMANTVYEKPRWFPRGASSDHRPVYTTFTYTNQRHDPDPRPATRVDPVIERNIQLMVDMGIDPRLALDTLQRMGNDVERDSSCYSLIII